jgi:hypothetical protein
VLYVHLNFVERSLASCWLVAPGIDIISEGVGGAEV